MSFREKSAWISLLLLFLLGGTYFGNFARILAGRHALSDLHLFFALIVALIVAEVVLHVAIAIRSPEDARTPRDERERASSGDRIAMATWSTTSATNGTMHLHLRDPGDRAWL